MRKDIPLPSTSVSFPDCTADSDSFIPFVVLVVIFLAVILANSTSAWITWSVDVVSRSSIFTSWSVFEVMLIVLNPGRCKLPKMYRFKFAIPLKFYYCLAIDFLCYANPENTVSESVPFYTVYSVHHQIFYFQVVVINCTS